MDSLGTRTGSYAIVNQGMSGPGCVSASYGVLTTDTIDVGDIDCYTFAATTHDVLRLRVA